uniref:uncharacterized protein LOC117165099 n=1 Tax=Bombus vancouverensis nearcticus TaxID=2705178 RepID=UPI00143C3D18|nr:uncharacterized protein LOC117165099 [Bombus vancouverensis nearcticus]
MLKQNATVMASQPICVPPMKPQKITFWFSLLERQLAAAGIELRMLHWISRSAVNTGADTCVFPRNKIRGPASKSDYELFAANGTRIATYGTITLSLDLALCRDSKWRFVVADVKTPIIGVDFLSHYGLLVDPRNKRLLQKTTQLSTRGFAAATGVGSIKTIDEEFPYHRLLAEFPALTRPPVFRRSSVKHGVHHHICTTPGTPVHAKPRRLAPD